SPTTWSSTGASCAGSASTSRRGRRAPCWPARRRCWRRRGTPARRPPATRPPTRRSPRSTAHWTTARPAPGSATGSSAAEPVPIRPGRYGRPAAARLLTFGSCGDICRVGIISGMPPEPFVYEARFRGRNTGRMVIILLVFCAVVIVLPAALWARIFVLAACAIGLVILLSAGLSPKTALRIDPSGITLCQSPFFRSAVNFYPWGDVRRIVLWRYERLEYLGVQRREGAPEPKGAFTGPASRAAARKTAQGVDPDVAMTRGAAD